MLASALYYAPPQMREVNEKVRKINEDAQVLFSRYKISGPTGWRYVRPTEKVGDKSADDVKQTTGIQWSGSGFFVTPDGYFLTNRHVATGEPDGAIDPNLTFRVRMDDGTEQTAKLIAVGDNADVALMKVDAPSPVSFLKLADTNPNQGADAMVLGYPATGFDEMIMQISVGKVKSVNTTDKWHVWYDLNTTHGNSGGPVIDKYGRVISILTAGRQAYNTTYVLGVGADQMKVFVDAIEPRTQGMKVEFESLPATPSDAPINSEKLAAQCRTSTLLVLAIRGDGKSTAVGTDKPTSAGAGDDDAPK